MTSFKEFCPGAAAALGVSEKSVNTRAKHLRTAGLMSSAGSGVKTDQLPRDATNLMLGLVQPGLVTDAPEIVRSLRGAHNQMRALRRLGLVRIPEERIICGLDESSTLGETLDAIYYLWALEGHVVLAGEEVASRVQMDLTTRPDGWKAKITFVSWDSSEETTVIYFHAPKRPGADLSKPEQRLSVTYHVPHESFEKIAWYLRGVGSQHDEMEAETAKAKAKAVKPKAKTVK